MSTKLYGLALNLKQKGRGTDKNYIKLEISNRPELTYGQKVIIVRDWR